MSDQELPTKYFRNQRSQEFRRKKRGLIEELAKNGGDARIRHASQLSLEGNVVEDPELLKIMALELNFTLDSSIKSISIKLRRDFSKSEFEISEK